MAFLPRASSVPSSTRSSTKCATTPSLPSEVMITSRSAPASAASAATNSMPGVSTTGSSSLGTVLVAGRKRVPKPAAGTIAVRGTETCGVAIVETISLTLWRPRASPQCENGCWQPVVRCPMTSGRSRPRRWPVMSTRWRSTAARCAPTSPSAPNRDRATCSMCWRAVRTGCCCRLRAPPDVGDAVALQWGEYRPGRAGGGAVRIARAGRALAAGDGGGRGERCLGSGAGRRPLRSAAGPGPRLLRPDAGAAGP